MGSYSRNTASMAVRTPQDNCASEFTGIVANPKKGVLLYTICLDLAPPEDDHVSVELRLGDLNQACTL